MAVRCRLGPVGCRFLADMGAEVIKIEPPNGAFERHWAGADRATVGDAFSWDAAGPYLAGGVIFAAGLYQLTAPKAASLAATPMRSSARR